MYVLDGVKYYVAFELINTFFKENETQLNQVKLYRNQLKFQQFNNSLSDFVNVPNQEITTNFSDSTNALSDNVNGSIRLKDQSSG